MTGRGGGVAMGSHQGVVLSAHLEKLEVHALVISPHLTVLLAEAIGERSSR